MSIPVAKAYVTKDDRIISMLDSLEEDIKCKLILTEKGVQKMSGRCSKKNRIDFLHMAFQLSKQIEHKQSDKTVSKWIKSAVEHETNS